jgi:UDP-3-O-[3-hydroxymyristoyl] N-acetylglucosamine deacetylase
MQQQTIKKSFALSGIGLHSGRAVAVKISPAPVNFGIIINQLPVSLANLTSTNRATSLGEVSLVEHLLSAAVGMGVSNLQVQVEGGELPALDGSALPYAKGLQEAGLVEQAKGTNLLKLTKTIQLNDGPYSLEARAYPGFKVTFVVNFKGVGEQVFSFDSAKDSYLKEIAPARTFGYLEEHEKLKKQGLGLGASLENALVLRTAGGYLNQPRFPEELARHKILDLIGDLALLGRPLEAEIIAQGSGHALNLELVRRLIENG